MERGKISYEKGREGGKDLSEEGRDRGGGPLLAQSFLFPLCSRCYGCNCDRRAPFHSQGLPSNLQSVTIITGYVMLGLRNQTTGLAIATVPAGSAMIELPVLSSYVASGKAAACLVLPTGTSQWSLASITSIRVRLINSIHVNGN